MKRALLALLLVGVAAVTPTAAQPWHVAAHASHAVANTVAPMSITSQTPTPLVVLMDISGSMGDSVPATKGNGTVVKLDAAKKALQAPIENEPPGASVGIWTFPGATSSSTSGCDDGDWLVNVNSGATTAKILHDITGLQADGDTPTGPALQDVVDSLKARGIESANIVVVSDGLYNCGDDPCAVAKSLANTGFTVSIQAVGFDISEDGAQDLKCMADATGGSYFNVSDGADLDRVITQLSTPTFKLTVGTFSDPIAGQTATIQATLTNTSAFDAHSVELRLGFEDTSGLLVPDVTPTAIGLGTLPAGQSESRSWSFVAGNAYDIRKAEYAVSASSFETLPAEVDGSFTTVIQKFKATDAGPLLRDLVGSGQSLVILGDSYSSGEGTADYLPASAGVSAQCHRSPKTYLAPAFDNAKVHVDILACSGATTEDFTASQADETTGKTLATPQLEQLDEVASVPGAAVLTVGGDDIDFKQIVTKCLDPRTSCASNQAWDSSELLAPAGIEDQLVRAYENAWLVLNQPKFLAERHGKYAPVIVLAYPNILHSTQDGVCRIDASGVDLKALGGVDVLNFSTDETKFGNELEDKLNAAIHTSVNQAAAAGYGVYFSDQTANAFRPNHTVCASSDASWVNQIIHSILNPASESMHPTPDGYVAEGDAVVQWSKGVTVVQPMAAARDRAADPNVVTALVDAANYAPPVGLDFGVASSNVVRPAQTVLVAVAGLGSSQVQITVHSQPELIGTLTPNSSGKVHGYITIPSDLSYGPHQIVIEGWESNGHEIVKVANITVRPPTPSWVYLIGIGGVVLVLAAVILGAIFLRRRWPRDAMGRV